MFHEDLFKRYSRQIVLKNIGLDGQRRLLNKRVVIIGLGALGSMSAMLLARIGVGEIKIVDRDYVEIDNLHRQILYDEEDAVYKLPKAEAAANKLKKINSSITITPVVSHVSHRNIENIVEGYDIIIDGTDNFETRFLINDVAIKNNIPWIYGSAIETYGMTMNIVPGETPCLRCIMREPPPPASLPTCETVGIIPSIASIISSIQVTEAIKILLNKSYRKDLFIVDVWNNEFTSIKINVDKNCPVCTLGEYEYLEGREYKTSVLCGRNAIQILPDREVSINLSSLAEKLSKIGKVRLSKFILHANISGYELSIFKDGRAIIKGTTDEKIAKSLYTRYIGI